LANITDWVLIPNPSPQAEKGAPVQHDDKDEKGEQKVLAGAANVPKYTVYAPVLWDLAKQNRKEMTEAEEKLWEELRNDKLGYKFRRQHAIDSYIVDFVCLQEALIIEVDGGYHETPEQQEYDSNRTKVLEQIGFTIIRFANEEVLTEIASVRNQIKQIINDRRLTRLSKPKLSGYTEAPLTTRGEGQGVRETNTMPGYAGSSWYFLRYMDPHNQQTFVDRKAADYWGQVDLYIGGTEHAVGHLLYSRMWTKVLFDLGYIGHEEPYKKLVNQGMIQGSSRFVYRVKFRSTVDDLVSELSAGKVNDEGDKFVYLSSNKFLEFKSLGPYEQSQYLQRSLPGYILPEDSVFITSSIHVDVSLVDGVELDIERFKASKPEHANAAFILEDGKYICGAEVEKMSKSKYNVVNPEDIVERFGADTFRMYEMFLGPVEQSKPWDTKGIEGVHRFLRKFWRLFSDELKGNVVTNDAPTAAELKVLHRTIKKIEDDTERFSFNTAVSAFMVCVNELNELKCHKRAILEPLVILLTPYAPHIAEELYQQLYAAHNYSSFGGGREGASVLDASFPAFDAKYLLESEKEYPVSINGKVRTNISISLEASQQDVEAIILGNEVVQKWLEGKPHKKIIYVKNKMINVVV